MTAPGPRRARRPDAPPASHTGRAPRSPSPDALPSWTLRPIGVVRSPWTYVHDAPRQAGGREGPPAEIVLRRGLQNCVRDLAGFERVWVVFVLSYARGWKPLVRPPRDTEKRGVLATRSPHRPNPIGLSAVRVLGVRGCVVTVAGHDLLDGTPVLDLKPYLPYCDSWPGSRAGYVDALPPDAPDHRWE